MGSLLRVVHDLLKEYSSDDFRMFCLLNHYAARVQLDDNGLLEAKQQWKSLKDVFFNDFLMIL